MRHLLLIAVLIINHCYAQESFQAVAKVHYMFKHINDTTQPENFLRDEVVTYIGQEGSYYTSYSSTRRSEQINAMMKDPGFDGNINIPRNTTDITESYLFKLLDEEFQEIRQLVSDRYIIDIDFPEQDWAIEDETREIGGYLCQKATTRFKGRDYTAWFTTELPFSYGPWKLHGLPGLILEAYDNKKEVVFEYNGFDKDLGDSPIALASRAGKVHRVTLAEFLKQKEAFDANPQAFISNRLGGSTTVSEVPTSSGGTARIVVGGSFTGSPSSSGRAAETAAVNRIRSINVNSQGDGSYNPSRNTNNPIELEP